MHWDEINFAFIFFQNQVSMLQRWSVQAAAKHRKGLTTRSLFSAGHRPLEVEASNAVVVKLRELSANIYEVGSK